MLQERIARVTERITKACVSAGRDPAGVQLVAVTKNHPREVVLAAIEAGLTTFGENRVQEAIGKYEGLQTKVDLKLIGHLQSNKARLVPGFFGWVESVDSLHIAEALSRRCAAAEASCAVLLQYNSSGEDSKSGFRDAGELLDAAGEIARMKGIEVRGVMTIGPFTPDITAVSNAFSATRRVWERLQSSLPHARVDVLSMGMTDDLEVAIGEGSTEVRIGTAIFGSRAP